MDSTAWMVLTGFLWVMLVLDTAALTVLAVDVLREWWRERKDV